jgi:epoxyqueuosine reductase
VNAKNVKELIKAIAVAHGFQRVSIASLEPLQAAKLEYENWLGNGFAAGMDYMKRNTELRTSPGLLYPGSLSAIIVAISYYTESGELSDHPFHGRVARYAVGLDYHAVIRARLRGLREALEKQLERPLLGKAFTDDVALHEQSFATRHGIGFKGRNTLVIGPQLSGSYYFLAELFCDLEVEPDGPYNGTCGSCSRCISACPTGAITQDGHVDANRCISYLTIENKGGIPEELRPMLGRWVFGCDICQEVCPYNQRPPETTWEEFRPEKGAGHYLDLMSLISIVDETEFRERFGHTPLRRPKRRGLLRNSLVVTGNLLSELRLMSSLSDVQLNWVRRITERLHMVVAQESDAMLREHAFWSLVQSPAASKRHALKLVADEKDELTIQFMERHLKNIN